MAAKSSIYRLLEYTVLPPRLRKYALAVLIDGRTHADACTILRLNTTRVNADPRLARLKAAWRAAETPAPREIAIPERFPADASETVARAFYEAARRIRRDEGEGVETEDATLARTTIVGHDGTRWLCDAEWEATRGKA